MSRVRHGSGLPEASLNGLGASALSRLALGAGDIVLLLSRQGVVVEAVAVGADPVDHVTAWIGRDWADTVTVESRIKIEQMLTDAVSDEPPRWRQVNHPSADGDVPVRYLTVGDAESDRILAVGSDMRATSVLQQRLIQAQQSLERDYLKLRQAEARYRLLFDLDGDAVLVVEAESRRIREANPAAARLTRSKPGALVNRGITGLFEAACQDDIVALLGAASVRDEIPPVSASLAGRGGTVSVSATAFRQDRVAYLLVRLTAAADATTLPQDVPLAAAIAALPDAIVLTDARLDIAFANMAFLDLAQEASAGRLAGLPLSDFLGRAGIDLDLIVEQVRQHGAARNVATVVRGRAGAIEEVEVSAAPSTGIDGDGFAFSIRSVARRLRDLPPAPNELPRSVEQLTELVGRMSLKDIVRESTDLIERLCIEAALQYTSDNRASAAEILGVSRQSLYSKLHRHGLGNLVSEED